MDSSFFDQLFSSFMFWKALAVVGVVGIVSFIYTLDTGRDISELFTAAPPSEEGARTDKGAGPQALPREGQ